MSAEIRITRKGVVVTILIIIVLMYMISGRGCPSKTIETDPLESVPLQFRDNSYLQNQGQVASSLLPTIYAITPTYARPVQKAELTRLSQTILLVPNIFWVLVEDADTTSSLVDNLLKRNHLESRSVQLNIKTPVDFKLKAKDPNWSKPRGVEQRNLALEWVRKKIVETPDKHSVVYFMDDDNSYSIQLFDEMTKIEPGKVGVWPVGLVGGLMVEKPLLNPTGIVTGFNAAWRPERQFPIDMAGFAINGDLLIKFPEAKFSYNVQRGDQETEILRHVTAVKDLQPLANMCKEVLVWHTRTETPKMNSEDKLKKSGKKRSDDGIEV